MHSSCACLFMRCIQFVIRVSWRYFTNVVQVAFSLRGWNGPFFALRGGARCASCEDFPFRAALLRCDRALFCAMGGSCRFSLTSSLDSSFPPALLLRRDHRRGLALTTWLLIWNRPLAPFKRKQISLELIRSDCRSSAHLQVVTWRHLLR